MNGAHPMFVCNECGYARYHRLNYCPRCPGKMRLERKEIPHPPSSAYGGTSWTELGGQASWLKKNAGLDYQDHEDREKAEMRGKLQRAEECIEQYAREIVPMKKALEDAGKILVVLAVQNDYPADGLLKRISECLKSSPCGSVSPFPAEGRTSERVRVLDALRRAWDRHPEMRLAQMIVNVNVHASNEMLESHFDRVALAADN